MNALVKLDGTEKALDDLYAHLRSSAPVQTMPLVIDSFAGGGGASTGIEDALRELKALGLIPDFGEDHVNFAINHDDKALAMHAANHPSTIHLPHDVWKVSLKQLVGDRPIGILWASPDCRHFSGAKGGQPVSKSVRDLAWVLQNWMSQLEEHQLPQILFLENVKEFMQWGPLVPHPTKRGEKIPCKKRKGQEFKRWIRALEKLGYVVEWRVIKACDFGAPTIRTRFYLVARRDGEAISWPEPTHFDPASPEVVSGLKPAWPIAADIIDWHRTCPSIFMTADDAKRYKKATGVDVRRPLKHNSLARLAKGLSRYVVEASKPFIVTCNHGGDGFRGQGLDSPFVTVAKARDAHGLVVPEIAAMPHMAAAMTEMYGRSDGRSVVDPLSTATGRGTHAPTTASLEPAGEVAALYVKREFGQSVGSTMRAPVGTITPGGQGKTGVVSAFLAQHNTGVIGHHPGEPVSTIVSKGCTQAVVAAHMMSLKGSDRRDGTVTDPHPTVCAGGQHSALVETPMEPVSADGLTEEQKVKARRVADFMREHGCWDEREFVFVGPYVLTDVGMRMLTARELARAQGFPDDYVLDAPYKGGVLNDTEQRHKIGNSVCRQVAKALVLANYRPTPTISSPPKLPEDEDMRIAA